MMKINIHKCCASKNVSQTCLAPCWAEWYNEGRRNREAPPKLLDVSGASFPGAAAASLAPLPPSTPEALRPVSVCSAAAASSYTAPPFVPPLKVRSKVYMAAVGRIGQHHRSCLRRTSPGAGATRLLRPRSYKWQSKQGGLSDHGGAGSKDEVGDRGERRKKAFLFLLLRQLILSLSSGITFGRSSCCSPTRRPRRPPPPPRSALRPRPCTCSSQRLCCTCTCSTCLWSTC